MTMRISSIQRRLEDRSSRPRAALLPTLLLGLAAPGLALAADPLSNLPFNIAGGAPNFDLRLRYEDVKLDGKLQAPVVHDEAQALTVRARLGYTTGKWNEIDSQLEFETLSNLGGDDYNSVLNKHSKYPVIADAQADEVNQVWVRYSGLPKTQIKIGRQRILLDNQRYIGNVGWRQNEMTYDAGLFTTTLVPLTTFTYAYLSNVNSFRYFDVDPSDAVKLDADVNLKGHLINAQVAAIDKKLVLTGYDYLLDFDEKHSPVGPPAAVAKQFLDTQTLGLRASGAIPLDPKLTLSYALEYADQQDYQEGPSIVDASYKLAEAGLAYTTLKATVGYELLSGDGTYAFQTPLATAHAFQGWADQFLVTPVAGLERAYVSLCATIAKVSMLAVYHDFHSDKGSQDYGSEIDLQASYPLMENFVLTAKFADYSANEYPVATAGTPPAALGVFDTRKTWVYAEYKF